uniref:Uncharacterized protein n=1 Tax=Oryza nivara TaxID=4536 RepID=A0A0E0H408_ORYNI
MAPPLPGRIRLLLQPLPRFKLSTECVASFQRTFFITLKKDGAVLNRVFQPYESHIPYLLHFLLDGSSDENQEVPQEDDGAMPTEKEPSVSFMSRTGKNSHATTDKTGRESFSRSDIIVGWEIQLGSLGFFAEGAGIGLLKRISRTPPNQMKHPPMNPVEESCQEFPGASSADDVIDDASESNWSHTHASGIHVDGRIILNLWRLMRAEIKLNNYSLEAVADEVLRKVKRTSVLACVFSIDFFSVLSRSSLYRVESIYALEIGPYTKLPCNFPRKLTGEITPYHIKISSDI